jgi:hypothetical protein
MSNCSRKFDLIGIDLRKIQAVMPKTATKGIITRGAFCR